jgi:hypothetical protein
MYKLLSLTKSPNVKKKYRVVLLNTDTLQKTSIDFGASDYCDYIMYSKYQSDEEADERKKMYIMRHQKREDWTKDGILTAGFWSFHLLWNERTLKDSLIKTLKKFNLKK